MIKFFHRLKAGCSKLFNATKSSKPSSELFLVLEEGWITLFANNIIHAYINKTLYLVYNDSLFIDSNKSINEDEGWTIYDFEMYDLTLTVDQFLNIKNGVILPSSKEKLLQQFARYQKLQVFQ